MGSLENLPAVVDPGYQNISVRRHFLSDKIDYKSFNSPVLLKTMVLDHYPEPLAENVVVCVDHVVVSRGEWDKLVVVPSQSIFMALVPAGGDGGGKQVLATVAMIAVAVLAPYAAAAVGAGAIGTLGNAIVAAGIAMVGSLAIGALFRPPTPDAPKADDETFSITGIRNRARPGAGFRRVLGRRKIFPDIAAIPFTVTEGDDQYLYALFDCGYGPLEISDMRIGNTPITQYDKVRSNVLTNAYDGKTKGDILQEYKNDHATKNIGQSLTVANGPVIVTTDGPANAGVIDVIFPVGLVRNRSSGDKDPVEVILDLEVAIDGTDNWIPYSDVKTNATGTGGDNRIDCLVQAQVRYTEAELTENNYAGSENDHVYQIEAGATVFTVETPQYSGVIEPRMLFTFGGQTLFISAVTSVAAGIWEVTTSTALQTTVDIGRRTTATPLPPADITLGANVRDMDFLRRGIQNTPQSLRIYRTKLKPFTVSFEVEFPNADEANPVQWKMRLTRITKDPEEGNTKIQSLTTITTMRTIRYNSPIDFEDPHTVIEVRIKATDQLQGNLDTLSCIARSQVKTYNKSGDVTNELSKTRNPAWLALHILTGNENPRPVSLDRIDFDSWVDFANFCNIVDPEDNQKRHLCDVDILGEGTVQRTVETILNTGRATLSMADGKYAVLYDEQPTEPIQLITTHNTLGMSASRNFIDPPHAIRAHFVDPQTDWAEAELMVYNDGYDKYDDPDNGKVAATKFEDMTLIGITRSQQVYRDVRYFLAQGILRQENITATMDWENLVATRGDLVHVQEESIFIGGLPGRVTGISGNNVRSSEPFNLQAEQYAVRIRDSHGLISYIDITAQVDEFTVTLASIPANLGIDDLLVWGVKDLETFPYIVKAVRPRPNMEAELTLMQLAPGVYTAEDEPIPGYNPGISPDLEAAPIIVPDVGAELISRDGPPAFTIVVEWNPIPRLIGYNVWLWSDAEPEWKIHGTAEEGQDRYVLFEDFRIDPDNYRYNNIYRIKVTGVNVYGRESSFPESPYVEFNPKTDTDIGGAPPELAFFDIDVRGEEVFLEWEVEEGFENIGGFIIKYTRNTGPANKGMWSYSQILARDVPWDARSATFPARVGTYMIKTFNIFGKVAVNANYAKTTIPSLPNLQFYETVDDAPEWTGVKTNVVVNKSALYLATDAEGFVENGNYAYATFIDLGDIYTIRAFSYFRWFGVGDSTLMSTWTSMSSVDPLSEPAPDGLTDAIQEINIYDPDKAEWTGWRTFVAGDYTGRFFAFRLQMASADPEYTPVVGSGEIELQIPYRYEQAFDMLCPEGGLRVEYPRPFFTPPALAVSAAHEINQWYRISNESETGFNIRFYNRGSGFHHYGAEAIQGTFDYQARGYGAKEWALPTKGQGNSGAQVLRPRGLGRGGERVVIKPERRTVQ